MDQIHSEHFGFHPGLMRWAGGGPGDWRNERTGKDVLVKLQQIQSKWLNATCGGAERLATAYE